MKPFDKYLILNSEDECKATWRDAMNSFGNKSKIFLTEFSENEAISSDEKFYLLISGGDGSLKFAVEFIKRHKCEKRCAILYHPNGTGNDFSRGIGLHGLELIEVCDLITNGHLQSLDVAKFEDSYYVNMGTFGAFAEITPEAPGESKAILGPMSYYIQGLKKLLSVEPFTCEFTFDGEEYSSERAIGFFLGNSKFCGAGVQVTPAAEIDDGYLDFFLVNDAPMTQLIQLALELQKKDIDLTGHDIVARKLKTFKFQASAPISITLDGEPERKLNGRISIEPRNLSILTPGH